jgi:hypothetical protein
MLCQRTYHEYNFHFFVRNYITSIITLILLQDLKKICWAVHDWLTTKSEVLEKLRVAQLVSKIPTVYSYYSAHKSLPLLSILARWMQSSSLHPISIRSVLILSSHLHLFPKWFLQVFRLKFSMTGYPTKILCIYSLWLLHENINLLQSDFPKQGERRSRWLDRKVL